MIKGRQSIYKYALLKSGSHSAIQIALPIDTKIISVQYQNETITMWAIVDTDAEVFPRRFWILGTGWDFPEGVALNHLATVLDRFGYVWHIFEEVI